MAFTFHLKNYVNSAREAKLPKEHEKNSKVLENLTVTELVTLENSHVLANKSGSQNDDFFHGLHSSLCFRSFSKYYSR